MVERGQTMCKRIDKRIEVVILQRSVHPAIALSDFGIEIVAAEHDLKSARSADQAREPFERSATRNQSDSNLRVAEQGALPTGEAHVAGQHELVADATRATANLGDAHDRRGREPQHKLAPKAENLGPLSCLGDIEMGNEELRI